MTTRRKFVALGAVGAAVAVAGCGDAVDFARGEGPLEFEAAPAAPSDEALEETGFVEQAVEEERLDEEVDVGVEREIRASFWIASYVKEIEVGGQSTEGAMFVAVSSPGISVLGSEQNPIADMDSRELIEEFGNESGDLKDLSHEGTYEVESLGETRTVDVFHATTEQNGREVDVRLEVTTFSHEGDVLVLFGVYPEDLPGEEFDLESLIESIDHPVEA